MAVVLDEPGHLVPDRIAARGFVGTQTIIMPARTDLLIRRPKISTRQPLVVHNSSTPFTGPTYVNNPTKAISGIIYGPGDAVVANAVVVLFRQSDHLYVAQSTTDAGGAYSFPRDETDVDAYYVLSYDPDAIPQIHGVSDRGLVPV